MAGPLDALRKLGLNIPDPAKSAPLAPGENMPGSGPSWLDPIVEGGLGFVGLGPDTKANRFGQMVAAGIPLFGAASRGISAAREAPEAVSAMRGLRGAAPAAEEAMNPGMKPPVKYRLPQSAGQMPHSNVDIDLPTGVQTLGQMSMEHTPVGRENVYNAMNPPDVFAPRGATNPKSDILANQWLNKEGPAQSLDWQKAYDARELASRAKYAPPSATAPKYRGSTGHGGSTVFIPD